MDPSLRLTFGSFQISPVNQLILLYVHCCCQRVDSWGNRSKNKIYHLFVIVRCFTRECSAFFTPLSLSLSHTRLVSSFQFYLKLSISYDRLRGLVFCTTESPLHRRQQGSYCNTKQVECPLPFHPHRDISHPVHGMHLVSFVEAVLQPF